MTGQRKAMGKSAAAVVAIALIAAISAAGLGPHRLAGSKVQPVQFSSHVVVIDVQPIDRVPNQF